jgi:hypothetical protein
MAVVGMVAVVAMEVAAIEAAVMAAIEEEVTVAIGAVGMADLEAGAATAEAI